MNTQQLTNDLLREITTADTRLKVAALRVLRGELPVSKDPEASLLLKSGPASRLLGVSKATFWRLLQQGRLKPVQITNKATFFRRRDIEALAGDPS